MEKVKIETNLREKVGKEAVKKSRRQGEVPAVIYGKDLNLPVSVPLESLRILRSIHFSESTIINMEVTGTEKKNSFPVLIKDIQHHPLTERVIHIDFLKVSLKEKIKVDVPLIFKGEPEGVKEGATVEYVLREIELEGLPLDLPEHIDVDVSHLQIGHSLHVKDLAIDGKIKVITPLEETIATLLAKVEEEEEVVPAEEGAVPEGPEVIKEKKEEEEEEEQPEKGEKPEKKEKPERKEKPEKPEKKG